MNIPSELLYTSDHEWVKIEGDVAIVGITDFAQGELGDIVYLDINTVGEEVSSGEVFGSIEAVKTVSDLFMPLSGEVLELNSELDAAPELVNQSPYENGWIVKIKYTDIEEKSKLLSDQAYKEVIGA